jgi:hypothetical protein
MKYSTDPDVLNAELIDQIKWLRAKTINEQLDCTARMSADRRKANPCTWKESSIFWLYAVDTTKKDTK